MAEGTPAAPGLHRTLERQLRRLGVTAAAPPDLDGWAGLLEAVSAAYQGADDDRYTMERSIEISSGEMRALHHELSEQARHDPLTGLPNRKAFRERLSAALAPGGRDVTVLFLDLDRFKLVNDSLGHAAGDALLVEAAERIRVMVGPADLVGRLGGDEFVVMLAAADPASGMALGRRLIAELERPFHVGGQDCFVSASIGVASASPAIEADVLLQQADLAMYRAKHAGRGVAVQFDGATRAAVEQRAELELALRQAVPRGELVLHFQPIVGLGDRGIRGCEALVRWERPGHGLVAPDAFIPVAEQSGVIVDVGRWVVATACATAAGWADDTQVVAVNFGAQELAREGVVGDICAALDASGLPARRLVVELTESTMLSEDSNVHRHLAQLRGLGVGLAIDDFGTGYSSLSHLRDLPATWLKVDRSFVRDVDSDVSARSIFGAIVDMAHALGLCVIAEGVERPAQLAAARALGCDLAQGYLLARPTAHPDLSAGALGDEQRAAAA